VPFQTYALRQESRLYSFLFTNDLEQWLKKTAHAQWICNTMGICKVDFNEKMV
jgi:hypothetical protein